MFAKRFARSAQLLGFLDEARLQRRSPWTKRFAKTSSTRKVSSAYRATCSFQATNVETAHPRRSSQPESHLYVLAHFDVRAGADVAACTNLLSGAGASNMADMALMGQRTKWMTLENRGFRACWYSPPWWDRWRFLIHGVLSELCGYGTDRTTSFTARDHETVACAAYASRPTSRPMRSSRAWTMRRPEPLAPVSRSGRTSDSAGRRMHAPSSLRVKMNLSQTGLLTFQPRSP
mmetsp:Transcript_15316/g.53386  ORF Transcript_15316/g.53386 Transcript_15316/m.53386 type:complete len:233 (-) Transcript_15316:114-812(-)